MTINWRQQTKGEDLRNYSERMVSGIKEVIAPYKISLAVFGDLVVQLHDKKCRDNHTDQCGFDYTDITTGWLENDFLRGQYDSRIKWIVGTIKLLKTMGSLELAQRAILAF